MADNSTILAGNSGIPGNPRVVVSAVGGGSGKTFITTGIIAALKESGIEVASFKKGPDYIDCKWLSLASERDCYNLDVYLFENSVKDSFLEHSKDSHISIIEGNHGLYDSIDSEGKGSTAYLARLLDAPVILIVNCSKLSRSVAAIINGFVNFEKETRILGVILNRVSGKRHEEKLREAIKLHCQIPVVGVVYKTESVELEQRHIGIITTEDKKEVYSTIEGLKKIAQGSIDLDKLVEISREVPPFLNVQQIKKEKPAKSVSVKIAIARDSAFNFYYPDNLQALRDEGAQLIEFSPLFDSTLPDVDAIYIGGGYPELYAYQLEKNYSMRDQIKKAIDSGLPTYAECGGLMFLSERIVWGEESHKMVGVVPGEIVMKKTPQGRGYVELQSIEITGVPTAWRIPSGKLLKAHEFHYSNLENLKGDHPYAFHMKRGVGISKNRDGILYKNVVALYSHLHALAVPWWGPCFVDVARRFKTLKSKGIES